MPVRIIKANLTSGTSNGETFNFVDLQRQGDDIIATARRQAEVIISQARDDAALIYEQTLDEARRSGRETGLHEAATDIARQADEIAEERITAQLATALPGLQAAAASLKAERDRWLIRWEHTAVRLGVAIAEKLIQKQLVARPDFATHMITDALRLAAGQEKLTIYLHPEDLAAWGDRAHQIVQSLTACADATLVPDDQNQRGGCRIETHHGEIDARVETMLQRIAEELVDG